MARPVVPVAIRGGVVRVDVAGAVVQTVDDVATATDSTHHVGINQVRVKKPSRMCTAIPDAEDYSILGFPSLVFGRKLRISYEVFME